MLRDRARELLPIIEAFANGKSIEYKNAGSWKLATGPNWSNGIQYRIKLEPKLVPFTFEDNKEFRDKWIYDTTQKSPEIMRITSYNNSNIHTEFKAIGYQSLFEDYLFEDGSPCGKYINE